MELLTEFSNKCPTYLETIWDELKEGLWCVLMIMIVIHSANSANNRKGYTISSTETPTPTFDFSALEMAAKVSKQREVREEREE